MGIRHCENAHCIVPEAGHAGRCRTGGKDVEVLASTIRGIEGAAVVRALNTIGDELHRLNAVLSGLTGMTDVQRTVDDPLYYLNTRRDR